MHESATFDLKVFRNGHDAILRMNGEVDDADFALVLVCVETLNKLARTPEEYLKLPPHIRCLLRGGAMQLGKRRYEQNDTRVFALVRDIVGNAERIKTHEQFRRRAQAFFGGVACLD